MERICRFEIRENNVMSSLFLHTSRSRNKKGNKEKTKRHSSGREKNLSLGVGRRNRMWKDFHQV